VADILEANYVYAKIYINRDRYRNMIKLTQQWTSFYIQEVETINHLKSNYLYNTIPQRGRVY